MYLGAFLGLAGLLTVAILPANAQDAASPTSPGTGFSSNPSGTPAPPSVLPEEVPRGQTVADRPRPDYDAMGVRVGSFLLYPDLDTSVAFSSNILGLPSNPQSDFIFTIQPAVDLKSDWNNNALNFHADGSINQYVEHPIQDYNDYTFSSDGRLDIDSSAFLFAGVGYSVRHQPVYSPNNLGSVLPSLQSLTPEEYSDLAARIGGEKRFNRLSFRLEGKFDNYDFNDSTSTTGTPIAFHLQNYSEEQFSLKTAYDLAPLRQIYVLTTYDIRNHEFNSDLFGFDRNSTGYTAALGANYDLTGIFFIDAYAGYFQQDYADARLSPLRGPTFQAKATWNVTRLTTITGTLTRGVAESDLPGVSGYVDTVGEVHADHELLRNLLLRASVGFEQDAFNGVSRTDNYYAAGVGAKYLVNRHFALSLDYTYQFRDSTQSINDFRANIVALRLSSHF